MIDTKTFSMIISDLEAYLERAKSYSKILEKQGDLVGVNEILTDLSMSGERLRLIADKFTELSEEQWIRMKPMKERREI